MVLQEQAEKAAYRMLMSGFQHHRYEDEVRSNNLILTLERDAFLELIHSDAVDTLVSTYADVLGPTRLRGIKNALICYIAPTCRLAIEHGADPEFCYALSDFYINYLEGLTSEKELADLFRQVSIHYFDLVQSEEQKSLSKPVASAVRFIGRNLYGSFSVEAVANSVGLERHYFSGLFAKQMGVSPGKYILLRKIEESKRLLMFTDISVTEVAESLGFFDTAHFSRRFKEVYGVSPTGMRRRDITKQ